MRVRRQLGLVEKYMREFVEFRRRGESVYAVERLALLLLQALLDLGAMLAVALGEAKPDTYKGIARLLADKLGVDERLRGFLEGAAGFRNLLVHGYAVIDRRLEEEAFSEIETLMPEVVARLRGLVEELKLDPVEVLKDDELGRVRRVLERYGVRYAFLFGSRARRGAGRDYDIAVSVKVSSALELGRLLVDLAEALGVHEDVVDLVHLESAPASLVHTVLLEGVLIYGDPEEAYADLAHRYIEYLDVNEALRAAERLLGKR